GPGKHSGVHVQSLPRRLIVVRVVHATSNRRIMIAQNGRRGVLSHQFRTLVGRAAVANGIAEAVVAVDVFASKCLEHGTEGLIVGVDVAEDADAHKVRNGVVTDGGPSVPGGQGVPTWPGLQRRPERREELASWFLTVRSRSSGS